MLGTRKIIIAVFFSTLIIGNFSCNNESQRMPDSISSENTTEEINGDTIRIGSSYYFFDYINEEDFLIKWGGNNYENISKDTFNTFENGNLHYTQYNDRYILLRQSCGTNCVLNFILPRENKSESIYDEVLYSDLSEEIILKTKNSQNGILEIIYLKGYPNKMITLEKPCPAINKSSCIDSVYVSNNNLIISYQGNKWTPNKHDNKRMIISL